MLLGNSAIQGMDAIDPAVFQQHADAKLRVWFNDGANGFQQLTSFASVHTDEFRSRLARFH